MAEEEEEEVETVVTNDGLEDITAEELAEFERLMTEVVLDEDGNLILPEGLSAYLITTHQGALDALPEVYAQYVADDD